MPITTELSIPKPLLALDVVGTLIVGLGLAKYWGGVDSVPAVLRFEGYGLAFIVIGALMVVPTVVFMFRTALDRAKAVQASPLPDEPQMDSVDRGFCLRYDRLSNRRKYIRTLWTSVLIIPSLAVSLHFIAGSNRWIVVPLFVVMVTVLSVLQAMVTYRAWKAEESIRRAPN